MNADITRRMILPAIAVAAIFSSLPAISDEEDVKSEIWSIARGGQLYDAWFKVLARPKPTTTHPLYPTAGKKSGAATWRCKECHGWDYRGAKGAYAKGSHYTGIKGIRDMVGADPEAIASLLRDPAHGYTKEMIPDDELLKLGRFVSLGQTDMDQWIERPSKTGRGDPKHGAAAYQTICAVCHGFDGKAINFKTPDKPEYIGTIAKENPWEFLHKTRFGQPGIPMIALVTLPMQDIVDILAFAQTLDVK